MPSYSRSPRRHSRSRSRGRFDDGGRRNLQRESYSHERANNDEDYCRLHVADLTTSVSQTDIERAFGKFGELRETWMAKNPPCFAFIVFKNRDDAQAALTEMDNRALGDCRIRVTVAKPRSAGGRRRFDPAMRCYQCGERGHFSRDCDSYSRGGGGGGSSGGGSSRRRRSSRSYSRDRYERRRSHSRGRYRSRSRSRGRY